MAVETVALSPEAHERLRRAKRDGETVDDVLRRLTGKRRTLLDCAGTWKDGPEERFPRFEPALAEGRRRDRERTRNRLGPKE